MKRNGEWIAEGVVFTASILAAWISRAWWIVLPTGILYMGIHAEGEYRRRKKIREIYAQIDRVLRGDYTTAFEEYLYPTIDPLVLFTTGANGILWLLSPA